jgi:uncharacterized protein YdeI (YjbR/CyaY-like superfamily)
MTMQDSFEHVEISSRADLRSWLAANDQRKESVWLVIWKKATGDRHVPYDAIVEEALCFGWIDSVPRKLDEQRSMLILSPRKPGSAWSGVNKARVGRLIAEGLMQPTGLAVITAAQADGSWSRLDSASALEVPPDLELAFAGHPGSAANFAAFPASTRRAILEWIIQAKTSPTRMKRIEETATLAAQNIRANQYRQPKS